MVFFQSSIRFFKKDKAAIVLLLELRILYGAQHPDGNGNHHYKVPRCTTTAEFKPKKELSIESSFGECSW
jgi:hypothetical protein